MKLWLQCLLASPPKFQMWEVVLQGLWWSCQRWQQGHTVRLHAADGWRAFCRSTYTTKFPMSRSILVSK